MKFVSVFGWNILTWAKLQLDSFSGLAGLSGLAGRWIMYRMVNDVYSLLTMVYLVSVGKWQLRILRFSQTVNTYVTCETKPNVWLLFPKKVKAKSMGAHKTVMSIHPNILDDRLTDQSEVGSCVLIFPYAQEELSWHSFLLRRAHFKPVNMCRSMLWQSPRCSPSACAPIRSTTSKSARITEKVYCAQNVVHSCHKCPCKHCI